MAFAAIRKQLRTLQKEWVLEWPNLFARRFVTQCFCSAILFLLSYNEYCKPLGLTRHLWSLLFL